MTPWITLTNSLWYCNQTRVTPCLVSLRVGKQKPWLADLLTPPLQSRAKLKDLYHLANTAACNVGTVQIFARFARPRKTFCLQSCQAGEIANFGKIPENFLQRSYIADC